MKVELTPCYILHCRNYRESSLLLDIFSREYGRLSLVAKGAKSNKKKASITYNLCQKYNISWLLKTELGTLLDIELGGNMHQLAPEYIMSGFYMNELTIRLLHKHEQHPELFDAYDNVINKLIEGDSEHTTLRYFEKKLLQSLGYGIVLDYDVDTGEAINPSREYYYQFEHGPTLRQTKTKSGINISGDTLLQLRDESLSEIKNINEAKNLMRTILNQYLGNRTLTSRQIYQAYIQNKKVV